MTSGKAKQLIPTFPYSMIESQREGYQDRLFNTKEVKNQVLLLMFFPCL